MELDRIAVDTTVGMVFSNLISFFIILTTAATLHTSGITNIDTAADARRRCGPIAGDLTFALFALGIIGTGLLAVPVLAGLGRLWRGRSFWLEGNARGQAREAVGFYSIIAVATVIGFALGFSPINPIQMLI